MSSAGQRHQSRRRLREFPARDVVAGPAAYGGAGLISIPEDPDSYEMMSVLLAQKARLLGRAV